MVRGTAMAQKLPAHRSHIDEVGDVNLLGDDDSYVCLVLLVSP